MSVSMYQSRVNRLNSAIATLESKLATEKSTQTKKEKEANSAEGSITKNTSATMRKQKQGKADRARTAATKAQDNIAKLQKDLSTKRKDLLSAEEGLRKARAQQDDKRRKTELQHEKVLTREAQKRQRLLSLAPELNQYAESVESTEGEDKPYDVFIAHAHEDKKDFADSLARLLREIGLEVWYDDFVLKYGVSLRRQIDDGIKQSRRGVVVVSHAFFAREWPQTELDAMMGIQMGGGGPFIFPIWHDIESEDVAKQSPILASIVAARTRVMDVEQIADAVAQSVPGFDAEAAEQTVVNAEVSKFTGQEGTMLQGLLNLNRRIFKYWYDVAHNYHPVYLSVMR